MVKRVRVWPYALIAVIVVWLFVFNGIGFISGLFVPASPGAPSGALFDTSVSSVDDGGNGVIQVASDGRSATITGSAATLAGESTVTVSLIIRQTPASVAATDSFTITADNPMYTTSGGATFKLVKEGMTCPTITYSQSGSGSGSATSSPCGFQGSLPSGAAMTVTMAISVNSAFFTNAPNPSQHTMTITTSDGNSVTVTWVISG